MSEGMSEAEVRDRLRGLLDFVSKDLGKDVGFAMFVETEDGWSYVSNCDRKDIVGNFTAWIDLTRRGLVKSPGRKESAVQLDDRLSLERRCAEMASRIRERMGNMGLVFFLFEGHNSAYVANVEDFRDRVVNWVSIQKSRS